MSTEITCATSLNRDSDGALIFFNCSSVMVSGFTISNCGGRETNDLSVQSILMKSTKDVIVKEIAVTNGTGHGLSFQNVKGQVLVLNTNFHIIDTNLIMIIKSVLDVCSSSTHPQTQVIMSHK